MLKVGLIGAGYIAEFHVAAVAASGVARVAAVCDPAAGKAAALAHRYGAVACSSVAQMLAEAPCDVVHVLTPPDLHAEPARQALEGDCHVLLEKPMSPDVEACCALSDLAKQRGLKLGVSHNFLFHPAYDQLRSDVRSGKLGKLDRLTINWDRPLGLIRSGPFHHWMLRDPANIMLETGSHLIASMIDLIGEPQRLSVDVTRPVDLPGGGRFYRRWQVRAWCGDTAIELNSSFIDGYPRFALEARGTLGLGTVEFDDNSYVLHRGTPYGMDVDRFVRQRCAGRATGRAAWSNLRQYIAAKLKLTRAGNSYEASIHRAVASFYATIHRGGEVDERLAATTGIRVIEQAQRIGDASGVRGERSIAAAPTYVSRNGDTRATVLVLGGTGFIGRELVRQLIESQYAVRMISRSGLAPAPGLGEHPRLEIVRGDMTDAAGLESSLPGVDCVLHLARSVTAQHWDDYQRQDVEPTRHLAELCLKHNVRRLIYTSTIDAMYNGERGGVITDATPPDPKVHRRNYYARCKAQSEAMLLAMHRDRGLPVVILRPGVVIGAGASPCHWGVGMWTSPGVVQYWGDGESQLPLVLVEDVAAALVRAIEAKDVEGRCFNLVDEPMLTARQYVAELESHGRLKIDQHATAIAKFYAQDMAKWLVKMMVRHPDRVRVPSYRDWASRGNRAVYDCTTARQMLGWQPCGDRQRLIERGIHAPVDEMLT